MNRFEDKVCLVTAAGSGIGQAIAVRLAEEGGHVIATDINLEAAEETAAQLSGNHLALACDVAEGVAVEAAMRRAVESFGGLDVVIANAGIHESTLAEDTSIEQLDEAIFNRTYEINLRGVFLSIKHAIPHLRKRGGGAIVAAGSTSSLTGYPFSSAYCATKAGVVLLVKVAATELADDGIRVNCYCPGTIDTPLVADFLDSMPDREAAVQTIVGPHLNRRLGAPEEVARVACFLASSEASFVTGAAYLVDGGTMAWRGIR